MICGMKRKKTGKIASKRQKNAAKVKMLKIFGFAFKDSHLAESALCHPSYRNENALHRRYDNFDRMEFFGDAILNFVICRKIYALFPDADEGVLSKLRSILVSRRILARIARETGLHKKILLGKSLMKQKMFMKAKIFADAFESFIAALYFDQGFEKTEKFILKHFSSYFDPKKLFRLDPNPKSTLQELVQKHWQKLPEYQTQVTEKGVETTVGIGRNRKTTALARTRQESEEKAARQLIRMLRQELVGRFDKKSSGKKLLKTL